MGKSDFKSYSGFYRAKVTLNKDPEKYGRVKVWIPDLMPLIDTNDSDFHLWARAANNPIGGRNNEESEDQYFQGSCYIPPIGSWVWIFFENDNPNRPYYWGALDIENSPVLAENQYGEEYQKKWTLIKTHEGRCIVTSDDPIDSRLELTGKKRSIKNQPSGDTTSVYKLIDNQTSILFDEREGKEKLLVKTYKGDYLNFDIETRKLHIYTADDIHFKTDKSIYMEAGKDIHMTSGGTTYSKSAVSTHIKAGENVNIDGIESYIQSGTALTATKSDPIGQRDQVITECALVVSLTDMSSVKVDELTEDWHGLSEEHIAHMEKVHEFIDEAVLALQGLNQNLGQNMSSAALQVDSLATDSNSLIENNKNNISPIVKSIQLEKIKKAQTSIISIRKSIGQHDPNMMDVYAKLDDVNSQLTGLSSITSNYDTLDGSLAGLDDQMQITNTAIKSEDVASIAQSTLDSESALQNYQTSTQSLINNFSSKSDAFANTSSHIDDFLGANTALDEIHQLGNSALDNISKEVYPQDKAAATTLILQESMVKDFDDWDSSKTKMESQISKSFDLLDFNNMKNKLDTIENGIQSNIGSSTQKYVDSSDNIYSVVNNASNIGAVGNEILSLSDEILSKANLLDTSSLQSAINEQSNLSTNITTYLNDLNNAISDIQLASSTLKSNSILISTQSTNLTISASDLKNLSSFVDMKSSSSNLKNAIIQPFTSLMVESDSLQDKFNLLNDKQTELENKLKDKKDNAFGLISSKAYKKQIQTTLETIDPDIYEENKISIQIQRDLIITIRINNLDSIIKSACLDLLSEKKLLDLSKKEWITKYMRDSDLELERLEQVKLDDNESWSPAYREEMYRHKFPVVGDLDYPPPFTQDDRLQEVTQLITKCV